MSDDSSKVGHLDRRDFIKTAGAGAGLILLGDAARAEAAPAGSAAVRSGASADIVVIGAGIWGSFTAYHLRKMGANVTLVDAYGPGNARSTSGDETRGVRSSYGDRPGALGELWMLWAREAMKRWLAFDDEWGRDMRLNLFHVTGDLILRDDWAVLLRPREILRGPPPDFGPGQYYLDYRVQRRRTGGAVLAEPVRLGDGEARFPVISLDDITAVLYEPDAGVVRARRAVHAVAAAYEKLGGKIVIGRASPLKVTNGRLEAISLDTGTTLHAETFVYAIGPWLGKTFPDLFAKKTRVPIGYVCYFATPIGDHRFTYPNLPSFNFPGVTGWPALPVDNRGFRVRGTERAPTPPGAVAGAGQASKNANGSTTDTGSNLANAAGDARQNNQQADVPPQQQDPDTSDRWLPPDRLEGSRRFVAHRFPLLKDAPIAQTHACHYESTSSNNFIIDKHPAWANVWIAAGGNAEGFKFGPKIGDYVAQRVMGVWADASVNNVFKIPEKEYEPPKTDSTKTTAKTPDD